MAQRKGYSRKLYELVWKIRDMSEENFGVSSFGEYCGVLSNLWCGYVLSRTVN
jgi:hypothetical protein